MTNTLLLQIFLNNYNCITKSRMRVKQIQARFSEIYKYYIFIILGKMFKSHI